MAIVERGFYWLDQKYFTALRNVGGEFTRKSERPYLVFSDKDEKGLLWAIPASSWDARTEEQKAKYIAYCQSPSDEMRHNYYAIGETTRPALFRVSNIIPITDKYIEREFTVGYAHVVMKKPAMWEEIGDKARRILADEGRFPNKYEQHITSVKGFVLAERAILQSSQARFYRAELEGRCTYRELPINAAALAGSEHINASRVFVERGEVVSVIVAKEDAAEWDEQIERELNRQGDLEHATSEPIISEIER